MIGINARTARKSENKQDTPKHSETNALVKSLRKWLTSIHPGFATGQIEVTLIFQQGISYEFEPRIAQSFFKLAN